MTYREKFVSYLTGQGLNMTRRRLDIAGLFGSLSGLHTVDEVYDILRTCKPGIGRSTVYRTLTLLVRAGLARQVRLGNGGTWFEPVDAVLHHDYLICRMCGRKASIHSEALEAAQSELATACGYQLVEHVPCLFGICPTCLSRLPKNERNNVRPSAGQG